MPSSLKLISAKPCPCAAEPNPAEFMPIPAAPRKYWGPWVLSGPSSVGANGPGGPGSLGAMRHLGALGSGGSGSPGALMALGV